MEIFLLRHGDAVEPHAWNGPDAGRPLTPEGARKIERAARGMVKLGVAVRRALTSPYDRARQTAEIVARELGIPLETSEALIPDASFDEFLALVRLYAPCGAALFVGHMPSIGEFAAGLIGAGSGAIDFKKGALARLDAESDASGRWTGSLRWLVTQKQLAETA